MMIALRKQERMEMALAERVAKETLDLENRPAAQAIRAGLFAAGVTNRRWSKVVPLAWGFRTCWRRGGQMA